jgi:hypothetical protein
MLPTLNSMRFNLHLPSQAAHEPSSPSSFFARPLQVPPQLLGAISTPCLAVRRLSITDSQTTQNRNLSPTKTPPPCMPASSRVRTALCLHHTIDQLTPQAPRLAIPLPHLHPNPAQNPLLSPPPPLLHRTCRLTQPIPTSTLRPLPR